MQKRQQVLELNYIRAITAFGIFAIHTTGGFVMYSEFNSLAMHFGMFINQFFTFGTPLFIMISGFVLFYNYRTPEEFNFIKFYKSKVVFLIVPFILWSIIYFFFSRWGYNIPLEEGWVVTLVYDILLGRAFSHLYFIFLIVQFYIIFPLFIKFLSKSMMNKPFRVLVIVLVLQASISIYEFYFRKHTNIPLIDIINSYYWKTIIGWFYYFIVGGIIAYHYERVVEFIDKKIKLVSFTYLISLVLFFGEVYLNVFKNNSVAYYERYGSIRPMAMIYTLMTFAILIWITRKINNNEKPIVSLLKSFGTYSLGFYFIHPMILEEVKMKLLGYFPNHIGYSRVSSLIIILGLGWLLTLGISYFIALFKWRWLFMGKVPQIELIRKKLSNYN